MFVFLLITCWSDCSTLVFPCPLVDAIWDADLIEQACFCFSYFGLYRHGDRCWSCQLLHVLPASAWSTQTPVASACSVKTDFLACTTQFCLGMGCTVTEAANRETLCRSYWWGWNCYYGLSNSNREQKNWLFNSYRLLFDCTSAGIILLCIYGKWLPLGWESSNSFCHNQC